MDNVQYNSKTKNSIKKHLKNIQTNHRRTSYFIKHIYIVSEWQKNSYVSQEHIQATGKDDHANRLYDMEAADDVGNARSAATDRQTDNNYVWHTCCLCCTASLMNFCQTSRRTLRHQHCHLHTVIYCIHQASATATADSSSIGYSYSRLISCPLLRDTVSVTAAAGLLHHSQHHYHLLTSSVLVFAEPLSGRPGTVPWCKLVQTGSVYTSDLCKCGQPQTMTHIVDSCPDSSLDDGLPRLHSADEYVSTWQNSVMKEALVIY